MIVFISEWFPSDERPFHTPFIEAHLKALSKQHNEKIIAITGNYTLSNRMQIQRGNNYINIRIPLKNSRNFLFNIILFNLHTIWIYFRVRKAHRPRVVIVNVFTSIVSAIFLKLFFRERLLFIEHWSFWVRRKVSFLHFFLDFTFEHIFVVSENLKSSFSSKLQNKTTIVENVVESSIFKYESAQVFEQYDFLFVGRLEKVKGLDLLLECYSEAYAKRSSLRLAIIGYGSEETKIKQFIKKNNLLENVAFLGAKSRDEIAEIMSSSKALIISSYTENKPTVICEAHCVGIPVLAVDVGGISTLIDSTNGMVVPRGKESLASAMSYDFWQQSFDPITISEDARKKYSSNAFYNSIQRFL